VIQRVVRQSFGRFRGCYEDGLRTNPNLEGRVTARFVIARDGSVATVQSGGTDLPDPRVVSCVLRAYSSLTFPSPKNGIVTVTYPLTFSPAA
jgi:outer membrane biosynthesis protein TonB